MVFVKVVVFSNYIKLLLYGLQWSTGVLPLGAGAILNQFVQQSQPMPRDDLRNSLKRHNEPPNISPPKQMRVGQPPPSMNNQQAMAVSLLLETVALCFSL